MKKSSLLSNYTKEQLADIVIMQEKNIEVLHETINRQYSNAMKLLEDMNLFNKTFQQSKNALGGMEL